MNVKEDKRAVSLPIAMTVVSGLASVYGENKISGGVVSATVYYSGGQLWLINDSTGGSYNHNCNMSWRAFGTA